MIARRGHGRTAASPEHFGDYDKGGYDKWINHFHGRDPGERIEGLKAQLKTVGKEM